MLDKIDLEEIKSIAIEAGKIIMKIYREDFVVEYKADDSPLTKADTLSNELICDGLQKLYPNIPIMSEENQEIPFDVRKNWQYYWCVDPIDGTKEFVKKNGEFTVNIALIHQNIPVLGVVYSPVLEDMYSAKKGLGAFKNGDRLPLFVNKTAEKIMRVVASASHLSSETQEFINGLPTQKIEQISKGSSLKLCMVAEGSADIYPRLAPTMEWDTAAAHAIVIEAGKRVVEYEKNSQITYNKENLLNPWFVVK